MILTSERPLLRWLGFAWLPGLVALQSIPHTGALRTLFLVIGVVHVTLLTRRSSHPMRLAGGLEGLLLTLLTVWLVVQSGLISTTPGDSLMALAGEWLKLLLLVALGILLIVSAGEPPDRAGWAGTGLFFGFFVHVISTLAFQFWALMRTGALAPGESFLGNYGYASPFVTGALVFLLAEVVARLRGQRWLPFSNLILLLTIVATLLAHTALNAKASIVVATLLFLVAVLATATEPKSRQWITLFLLGSVLTAAGGVLVSNRWQGASEAITAVIDSPADFSGLNRTIEPGESSYRFDRSFYDRAAWAKIALAGVSDHPLGLGYGADAFGRYVLERGGPAGVVSCHSGWLDFALANGVPGLLLLLTLFAIIMRRGWLAFRTGSPAGLATLLFTLNFALRSAFDGHLAASRLVGFAFVVAALWAMAARPHGERHAGHAD